MIDGSAWPSHFETATTFSRASSCTDANVCRSEWKPISRSSAYRLTVRNLPGFPAIGRFFSSGGPMSPAASRAGFHSVSLK
ncbi:hypothetical protein TUE45_06456 [Streptomyces reticuli]|nr:hypothetical protein TUE45_06456 [Streptomyces reticuli]